MRRVFSYGSTLACKRPQVSQASALIVKHKCLEARHSGRDCRNPGYMDVFELAIHGTGYPLPGGYDDTYAFVYSDKGYCSGNWKAKLQLRETGAWKRAMSFNCFTHHKLSIGCASFGMVSVLLFCNC